MKRTGTVPAPVLVRQRAVQLGAERARPSRVAEPCAGRCSDVGDLGADLVPDALVARRGEHAELHRARRAGQRRRDDLLRLVEVDPQVEARRRPGSAARRGRRARPRRPARRARRTGPVVASGSSRTRVSHGGVASIFERVGALLPASSRHYCVSSLGLVRLGRRTARGSQRRRRRRSNRARRRRARSRAARRPRRTRRARPAGRPAGRCARRGASCSGAGRVVVDDDDLDLAAVAGVDRARRVHQAEPGPGGQPGARVHEGGVPVGQRDRQPGRQHRPLARRERDVDGGDDVGAGVARQGVERQRQLGVEARHQDLRAGTGRRQVGCAQRSHGGRGYPRRREPPAATVPTAAAGDAADTARRLPRAAAHAVVVVPRRASASPRLLAAEFHIAGLPLTDWIPFVHAAAARRSSSSGGSAAAGSRSATASCASAAPTCRCSYVSGAVALDARDAAPGRRPRGRPRGVRVDPAVDRARACRSGSTTRTTRRRTGSSARGTRTGRRRRQRRS